MHPCQSRGSPNKDLGRQYAVEEVSTEDGISALEADWNRLSETAEHPNVFMTYGWFLAWSKQLAREDSRGRSQPHLLVLKEGASVVGVAPLARRVVSRFGFNVRKLEFVTNHSDYNDLVLGDDPVGQIKAIADFLARTTKQWDIVDLRDLRDTGDSIARIERELVIAGLSYRLFPEKQRCPYLKINGPWSTMRRKHLRFARRAFVGFTQKASEGFRTRIVENPQQEPGLLEKMIALEAQKRSGGELSQPFLGRYPQVFQSLFDVLGRQGWIAVVLVEWNDRLVASRFLYRCDKKLWDYLTAYDNAFSKLSPGTVAVCAAIDYAFAHGFDEFDFMRGEESYKQRWSSSFHQNYRLLIWNQRRMSRLCKFVYCDAKTAIYHSLTGNI